MTEATRDDGGPIVCACVYVVFSPFRAGAPVPGPKSRPYCYLRLPSSLLSPTTHLMRLVSTKLCRSATSRLGMLRSTVFGSSALSYSGVAFALPHGMHRVGCAAVASLANAGASAASTESDTLSVPPLPPPILARRAMSGSVASRAAVYPRSMRAG